MHTCRDDSLRCRIEALKVVRNAPALSDFDRMRVRGRRFRILCKSICAARLTVRDTIVQDRDWRQHLFGVELFDRRLQGACCMRALYLRFVKQSEFARGLSPHQHLPIVTHMQKLCHIQVDESCHIWSSHATHRWLRHATREWYIHANAIYSRPTSNCRLSHICKGHVTHM